MNIRRIPFTAGVEGIRAGDVRIVNKKGVDPFAVFVDSFDALLR